MSCGRRFGKTFLGALAALQAALDGKVVWWVAPVYGIAQIGWEHLRAWCRMIPNAARSETDKRINLPGGGWVQVRSADNPDNLRGRGLDLLIADEAAFMPEVAWIEALRPALADRRGRALFLGTPNGRNWFWRAYLDGQDPHQPEWLSWQAPTASNPFIPRAELEAAKRGSPERVWRQEFLAEFIEDGAGVFRRVREVVGTPTREPRPGAQYVAGIDWGKSNDWTVITVIDVATRSVVHMDRFNQIDYRFQLGRLRAVVDRWKPLRIIAERNSMGEPLIESLVHAGLPVEPFLTTNATKAAAVEALALAFERSEITLPDEPVLIAELEAFASERLPSGLTRYAAPEGLHDDCVVSLALAWTAAAAPALSAAAVPLRRGAGARF